MKKSHRKVSKNKQEIAHYINEFVSRVSRGRMMYEREWFTSILFQRGHQWVSYNELRRTFTQTNIRKRLPRPVTNKYAESGSTLISALLNYDPRTTYAPQTNNADDLRSAVAANSVIKAIENETNWQKRRAEATPWLVYTGNVFFLSGFDDEAGKFLPQKTLYCVNSKFGGTCTYTEQVDSSFDEDDAECPECAQRGVSAPMMEEQTPEGDPVEELKAQGCMTMEVVNPFELFFDYSLPSFDMSPLVVRIHSKATQWVRDTYNITDELSQLRRTELNARFRTGLHNAAPTGEEAPVDQVDVVEAWCKPCRKFPNGFWATMIGQDRIVALEPYKWVSKEGKVYLPIVHMMYERTPGSCYGRSPMFDLIEKQRMRNRVEGLGELCLGRTANPVWILPRGTESDPSGNVGQVLFFDPERTNQHFPRRDEGREVPQSIVLWLERIDREMYSLAGIPELTRGERPLSVKTGFGIEKLEAAAQARQSQVLTNIAVASGEIQTVMLEIFRTSQPTGRFMRVFGKSAGWTVKKIKDVDLKGGVDIWTEVGGTLPKTPLEKQAQLDLFIQGGLLDVQDPIMRHRIYTQYGMDDLNPQVSADLMQIAREHDRFYNDKIDPTTKPWDSHELHFQFHTQEMKEEAFEDQPPERQQVFWMHAQEHLAFIVQKQAAQLTAQSQGATQ
jgi:hypothetical protein